MRSAISSGDRPASKGQISGLNDPFELRAWHMPILISLCVKAPDTDQRVQAMIHVKHGWNGLPEAVDVPRYIGTLLAGIVEL